MDAKDLPLAWWQFIQPDPCECGHEFDQERTQFERTQAGLVLVCPNCPRRRKLQLKLE